MVLRPDLRVYEEDTNGIRLYRRLRFELHILSELKPRLISERFS